MHSLRAVILTALLVAALVALPVTAQANQPQRATLAVEGMTCSGCENTIESVLKSMSGVTGAHADRSTATVSVTYDAALTAPKALVAAINDNTYYHASLSGAPAAAATPSAAVSDPTPAASGVNPALILAVLVAGGALALLGVRLQRRRGGGPAA